MLGRILVMMMTPFIAITADTLPDNQIETGGETVISESGYETQDMAIEAYSVLFETFERNTETFVYPDDYCGEYIGEDNKLHIIVTDEASFQEYYEILEDYLDVIDMSTSKWSHNYLMSEMEQFIDGIPKCAWVSYGVDVYSNMGCIDTISGYEEYIIDNYELEYDKNTDRYIYKDCITFDFGYSSFNLESSYAAGTVISCPLTGTMGGSGTYGNGVGLVTAGHCSVNIGNSASISGVGVGTVVKRKYESGGYGDYTIIYANNNTTATNMIIAGGGAMNYIHGYVNNPSVGTVLNKFGFVSLNAVCVVTATDMTVNTGTVSIHGMLKTKILSGSTADGDSGGPCWKNDYFYGIHCGSSVADGSDVQYAYFTPNEYLVSQGFYIATN